MSNARVAGLDMLESRRSKVEKYVEAYKRRVSKAYDKTVKPRTFQVGDIVMKTAKHIQQDISAPKFAPTWEGPYVVIKISPSGYYKILAVKGGFEGNIINEKWLKAYYV